MTSIRHGLTPKMRPLGPRKSAVLSVLDVGTSKVACLIARLDPADEAEVLRGRTHRAQVLGIGHQRSRGLKGGIVVDMDEAERSIRHAVDAAERMAGVQIEGAIVAITGGRIASQTFRAQVALSGRAIAERDVNKVMDAATAHPMPGGRAVLHSLPTGFVLDGARGIRDPRGMLGERLGVDMHVASCDTPAVRNLMLAVERCHLTIDAVVATPYASALATLVDDEAEMGAAAIDMGGGTTSVAVFAGGHLVHLDAIAVGGHHVTMDIARGLSMRLDDAERLKALSASCVETAADERDLIGIPQVVEEERGQSAMIPRGRLTRIVKPRVEEILELVRDRLKAAGFAGSTLRGVVLAGGASQLAGMPQLASQILGCQARAARPVGIKGLPESAKNPAFAGVVGLLVYPQFASLEHFEPGREGLFSATGTDGYLSRMGRWLKDSF